MHTYIVFSPKQIKPSNAIVLDDNKNVILPSQRFNSESEDIRYSIDIDTTLTNSEKAFISQRLMEIEEQGDNGYATSMDGDIILWNRSSTRYYYVQKDFEGDFVLNRVIDLNIDKSDVTNAATFHEELIDYEKSGSKVSISKYAQTYLGMYRSYFHKGDSIRIYDDEYNGRYRGFSIGNHGNIRRTTGRNNRAIQNGRGNNEEKRSSFAEVSKYSVDVDPFMEAFDEIDSQQKAEEEQIYSMIKQGLESGSFANEIVSENIARKIKKQYGSKISMNNPPKMV